MCTQQQVYKKDGEGVTYALKQHVFEGEIIEGGPGFLDLSKMITDIRLLHPREDDVLLITYPKSGTNWMYDILSILKKGELVYNKTSFLQRFLEFMTDFDRNNHGTDSVIYATHLLKKYIPDYVLRKPKVIFMIRNPKSVAVSHYSHIKRAKQYDYEGTFAGFFPVFMQGFISIWGDWLKHLTEYWAHLKDFTNVHFVFYEELRKDPVKEVMKISEFLGYKRDAAFCEEVVRMTSIENMKKLEQERLLEFNTMYWRKGEEGFVQEGKIDGWKEHFTETQNMQMDSAYDEAFAKYPELKQRIQFY